MKYFSKYTAMAAAALSLSLVACDDDLDQYKVSTLSEPTVVLESGDVVPITLGNLNKVVLQMAYTAEAHDLYLTNTYASSTLGDGYYALEISPKQDFSENLVTRSLSDHIKGPNDIYYTGSQLNNMAQQLGIAAGDTGTLYFRVGHSYNADDAAKMIYTETINIKVVPLYIDMHAVWLLNQSQGAVIDTLYSDTENGIYTGFFTAQSTWFNFWILDNQQRVWGNTSQGDFAYAVTAEAWNFWTSDYSGCTYLTFDMNKQYITFTALQDLSVSGGASEKLIFDYSTAIWSGVFETSADNANITLSGTTYTNDNGTGDNKDNSRVGTMYFAASTDGTLEIADASTSISIPKAGKYKIDVNLDGHYYTYSIKNMDNVVVYPTALSAKVGETSVDLDVTMADGLATGLYTGTVEATEAGQTVQFVDGSGNVVKEGTLEKAAKYSVVLNLATDELTFEEITYEIAATLGLYYGSDYQYIQATYHSGWTSEGALSGVYTGLFYKDKDDWDFYGRDGNNVAFGSDGSAALSFVNGSTKNFWVSATETSYLYIFDVANASRTEYIVDSLALLGQFNEYGKKPTGRFTNGGDGVWTLSDFVLENDEEWNPYVMPKFKDAEGNPTSTDWEWNYELYGTSTDGSTSAIQCKNGNAVVKTAGTYDIVVNFKTNTITVTSK